VDGLLGPELFLREKPIVVNVGIDKFNKKLI
jgi:hypothetical protein